MVQLRLCLSLLVGQRTKVGLNIKCILKSLCVIRICVKFDAALISFLESHGTKFSIFVLKKLVELVVFVIVAAVSFAVSVVDEEKPNVSEENDDKHQRK